MYLEEKNKLFKKMKTQNFSEIVEGSFVQVETSLFSKTDNLFLFFGILRVAED